MQAEALAEQVVGIDIHPLSVLIAKTTILLALGNNRIVGIIGITALFGENDFHALVEVGAVIRFTNR